MMTTGKIKYSSSAAKVYENEVRSLENKLNTSLLNAARERAAQRMANVEVENAKLANPNLSKSDVKKKSQQYLTSARQSVGSIARSKRSIQITDKEWDAIQAGAISENQLKKILNNTDVDVLRDKATPRTRTTLSQAKVNKIKAMSASNHTLAEIAKACGVSRSVVSDYLKGENE
jgi:predicted secreted protein